MDKEIFEKFIDRPQALFEIVEEVANGGSLISLCKREKLRYSSVINWIYESEERQKGYEAALEARGEYAAQKILRELDRLGYPDIKKLYNDDGSIKEVSQLDDDIASAIASIEIQEEVVDKEGKTVVPRTRKIKLVDKIKAIEMLGRNLTMFTDKVEHSGKVSLEDLVNGSMAAPEKEPEKEEKSNDLDGATVHTKPGEEKIIGKEGGEIKSESTINKDSFEENENGKAEIKPQENKAAEADDGI